MIIYMQRMLIIYRENKYWLDPYDVFVFMYKTGITGYSLPLPDTLFVPPHKAQKARITRTNPNGSHNIRLEGETRVIKGLHITTIHGTKKYDKIPEQNRYDTI
jgi:hypothetical protein